MPNKKITVCPNCNSSCIIEQNLAYEIEKKYAPFWFFDAMNQFENFNKIKCPSCGNIYKSEEARLLFVFKSPYTVVIFCLLFIVIAVGFLIFIK